MASSSSFTWSPPHFDFDAPLRAKACGECRRRKVKCDGVLPVCGRCALAGHDEDCEYVLEDGMTRSEALEHDIHVLEARIKELEARPRRPTRITPSPKHRPRPGGIPGTLIPEIVGAFFLHASQLGLFIRRDSFSEALYSIPPSSGLPFPLHASYSPFLFHSAFLLGLHFCRSDIARVHEEAFLCKTLKASAAPAQPRYIVSDIQAEVLLAHYFLIQGRLIEAMDHINAAVSLNIGNTVYETPGVRSRSPTTPLQEQNLQADRLHARSVLFILHKTWGVALQWPSTIPEFDVRIDNFSFGALNSGNEAIASPARIARMTRAVSLYSRAVSIADTPHLTSTGTFHELDGSLFDFLRSIQPLDYATTLSLDLKRNHLLGFIMAQTAVIRLYGNITEMFAFQKCLVAALSVSAELQRITDLHDWQFVDPVVGTLLPPVCQILIRGIVNGSREHGGPDSFLHALRQITTAMLTLGHLCPFINHQFLKIQSMYPVPSISSDKKTWNASCAFLRSSFIPCSLPSASPSLRPIRIPSLNADARAAFVPSAKPVSNIFCLSSFRRFIMPSLTPSSHPWSLASWLRTVNCSSRSSALVLDTRRASSSLSSSRCKHL